MLKIRVIITKKENKTRNTEQIGNPKRIKAFQIKKLLIIFQPQDLGIVTLFIYVVEIMEGGVDEWCRKRWFCARVRAWQFWYARKLRRSPNNINILILKREITQKGTHQHV